MKCAVVVALTGALIALSVVPAEAQSRRPYPGWQQDVHDRYEDRKNRRKARRAGFVGGLIVSGVTREAENRKAEERYEECMRFDYYDVDCDRELSRDRRKARKKALRTGVVAGIITRDVVRD
jgi:hypothetical protein